MSFDDKGKDVEGNRGRVASPQAIEDVFGDETNHDIQYKTLSWQVSGKSYCKTCAPTTTQHIYGDDKKAGKFNYLHRLPVVLCTD